jgi:hypothetical protein
MNDSASAGVEKTEEVEDENNNSNRLLIGIAIGAVVLIAIALGVTLLQPKQDYLPEDTPDGVAHNYLFALDEREYQRAYSYLSDTLPGYPENLDVFTESIEDSSWFRVDRDSIFRIERDNSRDNFATITIQETEFYSGDIFGSNEYSRDFKMKLQLENGEWKITDSDRYFPWCWQREEGCQ